MKAVMLMFDSLNRHYLPVYGCDWVKAPNFQRLAAQSVTFDQSYVCSMPCMPARRDFHTGRPNFLHRSWGPLEPFDDSVPAMLGDAGVHTHLVSDHFHYWREGGATYHTKYSTWQAVRGQAEDPWQGIVGRPNDPASPRQRLGVQPTDFLRNQSVMQDESQTCIARTVGQGLQFLHRNATADSWFCQIECFDPHEPFCSPPAYRALYDIGPDDPAFEWPRYGRPDYSREQQDLLRRHYAALVSMCDAYLGKVLDAFDRLDLWQDTMLIVCADHGFMLGERGWYAKLRTPWFDELAHTPLFLWDPRHPRSAGLRREALVQPMLDLGPTLLHWFGLQKTPDMLGHDLDQTVADDAPVRDAAIFGHHGAQVNITDGRYVYFRAPQPDKQSDHLFEYTLMPSHISTPFACEKLQQAELVEPFDFTKGCPVLRVPGDSVFVFDDAQVADTCLYDLQRDPEQMSPLRDPSIESRMINMLLGEMNRCSAPLEQYQRLGITELSSQSL